MRFSPQKRLTDPSNDPSIPAAPRTSLLAAVVLLVAIAAFVEPLGGPWIFDDQALIPGNRFVHEFGSWHHWFSSHLWDTNYDPRTHKEFAFFWRPLLIATYAVDWRFGGGGSALFHVTNLVWHALAAVLAFAALRRWSGSTLPAFAAALIFAVHPTKAESVAWISGRADLVCATGVLLAARGIAGRLRGRRSGWTVEAIGTAIAYLSKEVAVTLPLFGAVEAWAVDRGALGDVDRRRIARAVVPQIVVAAIYLLARHLWLPIGAASHPTSAPTHAALALESVGRYAALCIWPGDLSLGRSFIRHTGPQPVPVLGYAALGVIGLAVLGVASAWTRRRRPAIAVGALLFVGSLLPVCNVVSIGYSVLISPRFLYLPLIGLGLMLADAFQALRARRAVIAGCAVTIAALFARSAVRSQDFDSEQRFWDYEIAHVPYYPPALVYQVSKALNDRRPRHALRLAHDAHATLLAVAPADASRTDLVLLTLNALSVLTPDLQRDDLIALRNFAGDLGAGRSAHLENGPLRLVFDVPAQDLAPSLRARALELTLFRGEISSRLGDDDQARGAARRLASQCPHCWTLMQTGVFVAARTGEIALARELLDDLERDAPRRHPEIAAQLDAAEQLLAAVRGIPGAGAALPMADFYSRLGAWGRAYAAATPALSDASHLDAGSCATLGELAYRAGDRDTAERLFARALPAPEVRARLEEIARSMHWIDAPAPASDGSRD